MAPPDCTIYFALGFVALTILIAVRRLANTFNGGSLYLAASLCGLSTSFILFFFSFLASRGRGDEPPPWMEIMGQMVSRFSSCVVGGVLIAIVSLIFLGRASGIFILLFKRLIARSKATADN